MTRLCCLCLVLFASFTSFGTTRYVATNGLDANTGTILSPYYTIAKAQTASSAGDTIYVRGGTYVYATTVKLTKNGNAAARFYLLAYPGERPLLSFATMTVSSSNQGISLSGNYWYVKGLDIYRAGDNGMYITGSHEIVEFCSFSENFDTGLQLSGGASNDTIINCDSYYNADIANGNADGFAAKLDVGTGVHFSGCRSWQNSDDGWDGYLRPADNVAWSMDNCWCFANGYLKDGSVSAGNGNGFKMGGSDNADLSHDIVITRCLSFYNRIKGFDQNNDRGNITLLNCTSYNNGTNYSVILGLASGKTLTVKNCISAGSGAVNLGSFAVQATNSWMSPFVVSNTDFASIDTTGVRGARNPDGSLPTLSFMHLATGSPLVNAGTNVGLPYNDAAPDLGCFETASIEGINNTQKKVGALHIYPTPASGAAYLSFYSKEKEAHVKVYSLTGAVVHQSPLAVQSGTENTVKLDLAGLAAGSYICVVESTTERMMGKVVVR